MIGYLRGRILEKTPPYLLVDVAGLGYEIQAPLSTFDKLSTEGESVLYTHLVVREDAQLLYGFSSRSERDLFRELIKISGVGPKMGLSILSVLDMRSLIQCVQESDVSMLTRIPGVGKKTAARLLVEIQGRMDKWINVGENISLTPANTNHSNLQENHQKITDAINALTGLGYKQHQARKAISMVKNKQELPTDKLIRQALQTMT